MPGLKRKDFLSTGQVAGLLGIAPRTVCKLIDSGRLPGFRLPGFHRRVRREDFDAYLRRNAVPGTESVLLVGLDLPIDAAKAPNAIRAAPLLASLPSVVVVDVAAVGTPEALELGRMAREADPACRLVCVPCDDADPERWKKAGWEVVQREGVGAALGVKRTA